MRLKFLSLFITLFVIFFIYNSSASIFYTDSFDTAVSGNDAPYGITMNASYFWIVDGSDDEVYQYHHNGTYTGTHWDTASSGNTDPRGITMNTTYFWIVDYGGVEVYQYHHNGTHTGTHWDTASSGNTNPVAITMNTTYFWIVDEYDEVYQYHHNGTYTGTHWDTASSGNTNPYGITINASYFWIVNYGSDDEVYQYHHNGTYTGTHWDTASSGNTNPYGITMNASYFWITDYINDEVYQYLYNNTLPTVPTSFTNLGNNLIDHTPTISWTKGTDANGDTVSTYIYVGTTSTPTDEEGNTTSETFDLGNNIALSDGTTYYYRLRSYDGYEYSAYTTADEFRMNSLPSISNVTLSPIPTTDTDDLTANNDTATDPESDSITLYYRWYNNSILQTSLNDVVTVNQSNFTSGDVWKVGIIPNDGYENGTEVQSSTTTIGSSNVAPTLTGIQSNLTTRKYNQSVLISTLNATDDNNDNYILYIGTATGLSDLCTSASTPNGTQANCSFDVPWTSGSHTIYGRLYDGNDTSIEYTEVIIVDVTPPVIGTTSVSSASGLADFPFSISADVTVANGSVAWVYACVSKLGDTCTNYSLSNSGGSLYTGSYTDTTTAGNYYVTYYSSDDSGNIACKSTPDSITLAPSQGQGGGGGVTINETIIEIGDLTLTPPRLDTYFFLTSFDAPQTAEYTFITNRKVESCSIEPNDLTSCEIEEGYIIKARMIVNSSTESYMGKLTVVDESGYTASADIIVRIVDLGSAIPIAHIPVGGVLADMLSLFFVTADGALVGIRIWTLAGLFGGLIVAVWYSV